MSMDVYEMITQRFIEELEKNIIPWQKPWTGCRKGAFNRITKKPYSLLNQILLPMQGEWASFKQWSELGGTIKKGEKSSLVVFWKVHPIEETKEDGTKEVKQVPILRYFNVFHISQVNGVEPLEVAELTELEPIEEAERIKEEYKSRESIDIREIVTNEAFYSPGRDIIEIPCKEQYTDIAEFYSTLFHEITHSTGHKTRLDRLDASANLRNKSEYSKEELIAELGSAYILNMLGIETPKSFRNSVAYIQSWLQALKNDSRFIVSASSKAEKAVQYILNGKVEG